MEHVLRAHLVELSARFAAATGMSDGMVGRRALNDSTFMARIAEGQNFTVKTYDRLVSWFAANWPGDVEWPTNVPVPADEAS
ncbi:hypothetical protein [Terrihabitans sp. B22-R8]|uniref:hypothetical protein n=1 Tax=Terrihabitans sp. B22-R8 TaxID=3425128 RepID=UPI00403C23FA